MDEELREYIEKTVGESVDKAVAKMCLDKEKSTGQERRPGLSCRHIFTLLLASANYRGAKRLLQMYMRRQKDICVGQESKKPMSELKLFKAPAPKSDCVNVRLLEDFRQYSCYTFV